ncbi:MAG TPA: S41 family peptidase [Thermomicrobiaceae bacterium]|nr:S41 family peptidase [Thermomicrobiaceae bacterium]
MAAEAETSDGRANAAAVAVVLPSLGEALGLGGEAALRDFRRLLMQERAELEVELGGPVRFTDRDSGSGARLLIGPASANPGLAAYQGIPLGRPGIHVDRVRRAILVDSPDLAGIGEAMSLLRTVLLDDLDSADVADCLTLDEAIERVVVEVGRTYPAFAPRGLDWPSICQRQAERVLSAVDPLAAMQRWLAELRDCHSWVKERPSPVPLPYQLWVEEPRRGLGHQPRAVFVDVPEGTAAWEAGVRPGDELLDVDAAGWWERTGAPAHAKPLMTGYRLLSGQAGVQRELVARSPSGETRRWSEAPALTPPFPLVSWRRLDSGSGYLRIRQWRASPEFDDALDAAFRELRRFANGRLIVDLRGNAGGNLVRATAFRDRFLTQRTICGTIRFSDGRDGLSEPAPIVAEPAGEHDRWAGPVYFLTDPLTYSASEDALLGLQGLPWVRAIGEPSGGGSGRPRSLRLLPGMGLTVSMALTYDRQGRCIEGSGIPVDELVVPDRFSPDAPDVVLLAADRNW